MQPPSGGCVLKPLRSIHHDRQNKAAAFGRLCVETHKCAFLPHLECAAAFGRLCVETHMPMMLRYEFSAQPPSGGCVLKLNRHERGTR